MEKWQHCTLWFLVLQAKNSIIYSLQLRLRAYFYTKTCRILPFYYEDFDFQSLKNALFISIFEVCEICRIGERNKNPNYHTINDIQSQENKEVIFWRTNCIAVILFLYVIFYQTKELDIWLQHATRIQGIFSLLMKEEKN